MKVGTRSRQALLLLWVLLVSQCSVIHAENFEEQKNYYVGTPPTGSYNPPSGSSPGSYSPPSGSSPGSYNPPSGSSPGSYNPPSGSSPGSNNPPSHGSGGGHATPTPTCGNPPSGGHHGGNPPSGGHHHTPSPGGGYYNSPPTTTPTTPTTPTPPITSTPPTVGTPPTTPIDPGTPTTPPTTIPSPPFPITPPFTCIFWRNHPTLIWGLVGWWGTVANAFGMPATVPNGFGANMNLLQALSNTRDDGLGRLYREGTAALLNSIAYTKFPYTTTQVRDRFVMALSSNNAAKNQAQLFKMANEGKPLPKP